MLLAYILFRGLPYLDWQLIGSAASYLEDRIGIFPNILNTVYLVVTVMVIAVPLSIGAAIYLVEYAKNQWLISAIQLACEILTGVPSIIFGLVGMLVFVQLLGLQQGILAGSLTLVMMVVPTIIRTTQEALKAVPESYREGSLALGAGKWQMIRTVVLPCAMDGITTGAILAVGRIIGESAALLFTTGFGLVLNGYVKALTTSSASLTVALYVYATERGDTNVAFAIACMLMLICLAINFLCDLAGKKLKRG